MVRGDSNDGVLMTQGGALQRFENSRNVEMSSDLLIEERLRDWLKRDGRYGQGPLRLFVALKNTVIYRVQLF